MQSTGAASDSDPGSGDAPDRGKYATWIKVTTMAALPWPWIDEADHGHNHRNDHYNDHHNGHHIARNTLQCFLPSDREEGDNNEEDSDDDDEIIETFLGAVETKDATLQSNPLCLSQAGSDCACGL